MAEKNNANIGFEKQIWDAACVLWGHIPAADRTYMITTIKIHDAFGFENFAQKNERSFIEKGL